MTVKRKLLAIAIGAALSSTPVFAADDTKGVMVGEVLDNSGVVSGATVTITDEARGTTRTAVTDAAGDYQFPALNTGSYTVKVEKNGTVISERQGVVVSLGDKTVVNFGGRAMDEIVVTGSAMTTMDTSSAVKDFVVNTEELLSKVPVARDLTSVASLAPTAVGSDRSFAANNHDAEYISIGGASVAENACFLNGLNTTNFRNGLGCSQVPFEFYDTIQIKNGGYNAEFGRSIGGVLNATTKRGTNEFQFGANVYWTPDSLQGDYADTYNSVGDYRSDGKTDWDLWASGAIVQDKLFYYALVSPNTQTKSRKSLSQEFDSEWDDYFWGVKLDWFITDNHTLEYTGFDDSRDEVEVAVNYTAVADPGRTTYSRGGDNHVIKYTGILSDWATLSAQYGVNKYNRTDLGSLDANPVIIDARSGTGVAIGNWSNGQPSTKDDEREAYRIDVDFFFGDHNVRTGIDFETNIASEATTYSGGIYYRYVTIDPGSTYDGAVADNGYILAPGDEYVRVRNYQNVGEFETLANAFYIQDEWTVSDNLTLHFGLRNEAFDNKNAEGESFIKIDNQWAPRLGVSFDPTGDSTSRLYANWGRYFLPIAANTNIRMAGAELFTEDYYRLDGLGAGDTPIFDPTTHFDDQTFADGTVPDTRSILDDNIDPMYQDEFILGYEFELGDEWRLGAKYIRRDLQSTIEDIAIDAAVIDYYNTTGTWTAGGTVEDAFGGFHQYVLTNPGEDMVVYIPETDETISLSADQLGYPKAERTYQALEFTFDKAWDGKWLVGGSFVLSKLEGNHEGYVKSDNGQDDAGITTSFDQPGLTDGSFGKLPNDRPWALKAWSSYSFESGLLVGANMAARAGRPVNCIGVHPTDGFAAAYGAESFFCGGQPTERGSAGRTPSTWELNLSAQYTFEFDGAGALTLRGDVFNLFDNDKTVEVNELGEDDGGNPNPNYLAPSAYQLPRTVRLSAEFQF